jgi:hypothetical protein
MMTFFQQNITCHANFKLTSILQSIQGKKQRESGRGLNALFPPAVGQGKDKNSEVAAPEIFESKIKISKLLWTIEAEEK